jgi:hypothetical protein
VKASEYGCPVRGIEPGPLIVSGTLAMAMVIWIRFDTPSASVTSTRKLNVPTCVGVPCRRPVASRVRPGGGGVERQVSSMQMRGIDQLNGPVPVLDVSW